MDDMRNTSLSGPNSVYSTSKYLLILKNILSESGPRAIIYTQLLDSGIIERYFKVCEYSRLTGLKGTNVDDYIRALRIKRSLTETWFINFRTKYDQEQNLILEKNNSEIMAIVTDNAKKNIQKLSWQDSLYTGFFIQGGLSY